MRNWHKLTALVLSLLAFALLTTAAAAAATTQTHRVSVSSAGVQGNGDSGSSAPRSRPTAATWPSTPLPATWSSGDTNGYTDVFVRDRKLHKTSRVSVSRPGSRATAPATRPRSRPTAATWSSSPLPATW